MSGVWIATLALGAFLGFPFVLYAGLVLWYHVRRGLPWGEPEACEVEHEGHAHVLGYFAARRDARRKAWRWN